MTREEFQPQRKVVAAAVVTVAANYVYFLVFAQFGFLKILQAGPGATAGMIKPVMAVMGLAGMAGSIAAAHWFSPERSRRALAMGLMLNAVAAGLALLGGARAIFYLAALLVGLGIGLTTVTLAGILRRALGDARLGASIGLGTGLAYGFCNLPAVFNASGAAQAGLALLATGAGLLGAAGLDLRALQERPVDRDYAPAGVAVWTLIFFALVGLDSAAFYIIQHTPALKGDTWAGAWRLELNAGVHVVTALLAGVMLDRQWLGRTVALSAALLLSACWLINETRGALAEGTLLYTAGVSIYSTALVFYPARSLRPWLAAVIYAVAGWGGSALGIGFADNLHTVPAWFIGVAATVLLVALLARRLMRPPMAGVAAGGLVLLLSIAAAPRAKGAGAEVVAQGRQVFIREGCIHCHSQYARPDTADEDRWGPARPLTAATAQIPPLFGNRRQGPDLQNVGARRNAEWNRVHLISPRAITPGSRMPSYARLFAPGHTEGGALLAYLASLGADTFEERSAEMWRWQPAAGAKIFPAEKQHMIFGQWCASCHGADGQGGGPGAIALVNKPRDLVAEAWRFVPAGAGPAAEQLALARVVKFGVPGTAMAGREYLADDAVLSLAAYLQTLRAK
ncbi:MAG: hypothetical protein JWQ83_857 [Lacunisphaera sp.]|nr:hypothetical protein [Lacunisphaera sp.]